MNPVLFLVVEDNRNKGGGGYGAGQKNKLLTDEAIRCVTSWRKFGGVWKDISIVAMCITGNLPPVETINKLKNLGVTFIEEYQPETKNYPAGWWSTPLAGRLIEAYNTIDDFIIHIDLDMFLVKHLLEYDILSSSEYLAACAVYSNGYEDDKQIDPRWKKTFVTCFITSWNSNKFYTKWYNKMMNLNEVWKNKFPDEIAGLKQWNKPDWWDYCNLEEHAVDCLYYEDREIIDKVHKIQIGPYQGYEGVYNLTDKEFKKVCFVHNHIDNHDGYVKIMKEYASRRIEIANIKGWYEKDV